MFYTYFTYYRCNIVTRRADMSTVPLSPCEPMALNCLTFFLCCCFRVKWAPERIQLDLHGSICLRSQFRSSLKKQPPAKQKLGGKFSLSSVAWLPVASKVIAAKVSGVLSMCQTLGKVLQVFDLISSFEVRCNSPLI